MWSLWWVWMSAALVLAILEIFAPGFVLLGFAIGAALVGAVLAIGGPVGGFLAGSISVIALAFAVFSLIGWYGLRRVVGVRDRQIKIWDKDINDDPN